MAMVTSTNASVSARPSRMPRATSQSANGWERVLAPKAAEKKPARVTPTWTAARKRLGSLSSRWTACPRRPPLSAIARTWDSRSETRAISAPEKAPPIRTKTTTMTMLSQTSLTSGVLLQAVVLRQDCPALHHGSGCDAAQISPTELPPPTRVFRGDELGDPSHTAGLAGV